MNKHQKILSFIASIRNAFPDAAIIFLYGGCYSLYTILKQIYPQAHPYMTKNEEHIVTRINGRFYDILGEHIRLDGSAPERKPLSNVQMEYWETVASSQRVSHMMKKYENQKVD